MNEIYQGWYKCMKDNTSNKAIKVEIEDQKLRYVTIWKLITSN